MVKDGIRQRLTDSIETALKLAKGIVVADFVDLDEKDPDRRKPFSEKRACPNGHQLELDEIEPRTFSFNAPYGACPVCTGIGYKLEIDPELVIPDPSKTLNENAIEPWGMTKGTGEYYRHVLEGLGDEMGFDLDTPGRIFRKRPVKPLCMGVISRCRSRIVTVGVVCANIPPVSKAWCVR